MLTVLHVVSRQQQRGAETVAIELAAELSQLGIGGEVLAMGEAASGDPVPAVRVLRSGYGIRGAALLPIVVNLRRELRARRPDVILAHGGQAALASVLAARPLRIPVVWQRILEMPRFVRLGSHLLWPYVARRAAAVVAITRRQIDEMRKLGFRGRVELEPNHRRWARFAGIDRQECRATVRQKLGLDDGTPVVGFVGHLVDQKRPQLAVAAFQRLPHPEAVLVVAGAGPLHAAVREAADRAGIGERVLSLGHRTDVPELLAALDVLLITSGSETMTGVAIEAQMAGCPVVSFDLDGVDAVVVHGRTGYIVPMDDLAGMARRTAALLDDRERREAMAGAARERSRRFSTEDSVKRYAALLTRVARRERPAPRVLFLLPNFGVGGAERALLLIARHAGDAGFRAFAASLGPPRTDEADTVLGELRDLGVEVSDLGLRGRADRSPAVLARGALRLRRLCRKLGVDVVDSCLFEADLVARLAVRGTGIRHVAHLVNTPYDPAVAAHSRGRGGWRFAAVRAVDRATARLTDRFVAITEAVADAAVRDLRVPRDRIDIIPRGVDLGEFAVQPLHRDAAEPLCVLSVGRLVPQKDHRTAIAAVARLRTQGVAIAYSVVGEGPLRDELLYEAAAAGVGDAVALLPPTNDVVALHRDHHVFCFPSLWEGQGNALLEAMACGRPVIASELPATREVLGELGIYFPPADAAALADRLRELAGWPQQRLEELGTRLRQRAERCFPAREQAVRLAALYGEVLGGTARSAGSAGVPGTGPRGRPSLGSP